MAKDTRLFAKFTLGFPNNPKIKPLSDAAFRCLVEATIYSREHLTDGFLARRLALASWSLDVLQELCANDDEKPSLIEHPEGWYIRDYAEHQDTKAEIAARRERAVSAGQRGGLAKAKHTASEPLSKNVAEEEDNSLVTDVTKEGRARKNVRRTRIANDYMPRPDVVTKIRAEFPATNDIALKVAHEDFCLYWQGQGRPMADWDATWLRWMRKELARGACTPNGHTNTSTTDARVAAVQALKHTRLEVR